MIGGTTELVTHFEFLQRNSLIKRFEMVKGNLVALYSNEDINHIRILFSKDSEIFLSPRMSV